MKESVFSLFFFGIPFLDCVLLHVYHRRHLFGTNKAQKEKARFDILASAALGILHAMIFEATIFFGETFSDYVVKGKDYVFLLPCILLISLISLLYFLAPNKRTFMTARFAGIGGFLLFWIVALFAAPSRPVFLYSLSFFLKLFVGVSHISFDFVFLYLRGFRIKKERKRLQTQANMPQTPPEPYFYSDPKSHPEQTAEGGDEQ